MVDLEAALGRPMHLHAYAESPPSRQRLAAACEFALAAGEHTEEALADWITANSSAG